LKPEDFHKAMAEPDSIMIDVRNFNESLIGKFAPPPPEEGVEKVLDPCMRRSTEFPKWVEENKHKLEGKKVWGRRVAFHVLCLAKVWRRRVAFHVRCLT
jgi:UPF0176 protein